MESPPKISFSQLSNATSIWEMFSRFEHKFTLMYSKRAYIHAYYSEGFEEGQISNASHEFYDLLRDYQQIHIQCEEEQMKMNKIGEMEETKE